MVSSASRLEIHNNSQQRQYRTCSSKNDQFYVHYFRIHLFISPLSVPSSCMPYVEMTNFSLRIWDYCQFHLLVLHIVAWSMRKFMKHVYIYVDKPWLGLCSLVTKTVLIIVHALNPGCIMNLIGASIHLKSNGRRKEDDAEGFEEWFWREGREVPARANRERVTLEGVEDIFIWHATRLHPSFINWRRSQEWARQTASEQTLRSVPICLSFFLHLCPLSFAALLRVLFLYCTKPFRFAFVLITPSPVHLEHIRPRVNDKWRLVVSDVWEYSSLSRSRSRTHVAMSFPSWCSQFHVAANILEHFIVS